MMKGQIKTIQKNLDTSYIDKVYILKLQTHHCADFSANNNVLKLSIRNIQDILSYSTIL